MYKKNIIIKTILFLLLINSSSFACAVYTDHASMADVKVEVNAQKSNTSFSITWNFTKGFIASLQDHDKNKNGKFDKNEQEDIENEYISHLAKNNYITELVYVKKGQRIRKSLINKLNVKDSGLIFSDNGIKYYYNFDTDFVIEKDHRLFVRFIDPTEIWHIGLREVLVNNYSGTKVIAPQEIRANIYFYEHVAKYQKKLILSDAKNHKHDKEETHH